MFESPRRLNLRIRCTARTRVTATLNVWPALPIVIRGDYSNVNPGLSSTEGADNIAAALELKDRVHQISLWDYPSPLLERIVAAMMGPFPALTGLRITSESRGVMTPVAVFPEAFLGGSAPHLQSCSLVGIPFPGIQKLLLSTNQLVELTLRDIPPSGYISPEAMVTCLSVMPNLKTFWLGFYFPTSISIPDQLNHWQHPPPLTPAVLPSLAKFNFNGPSEYMEDLLSRIDAPLLYVVSIWLFNFPILETPHHHNILSHTQVFEPCSRAAVTFYDKRVDFRLGRQFGLSISCVTLSRHLPSLVQIFGLSLPPICALKFLDIRLGIWSRLHSQGVENVQWLELFRPLTALESLRLDEVFAQLIVPALRHSQLTTEGATQVLPALQVLFIVGPLYPIREAIDEFVTARQLSGLPVTIHNWDNGWRVTHPSPPSTS